MLIFNTVFEYANGSVGDMFDKDKAYANQLVVTAIRHFLPFQSIHHMHLINDLNRTVPHLENG